MAEPAAPTTGGSTSGSVPSGTPPPAAPAAAPPSPAPAQTTGASGGGAGAGPQPSTPIPGPTAPGTPTAASPAQPSVRDVLAGYGVPADRFGDDQQALAYLLQQAQAGQQAQQLAQYGQLYVQHADQFQRYMAEQRQQAEARRAQEQQSWWQAPPYDPSWESKLYRDAAGNLQVADGAPPDTKQKYLAWLDHYRRFTHDFAQDPIKAIRPGVEQVARQVAQEMLSQHMGQYDQRAQAQRLVEQNAEWIYDRDARTGARVVNDWGRLYGGYVAQAEKVGVQGVQAQHEYAMGLVERDYLRYKAQQPGQPGGGQPPADPAAASKNNFLQQAAAGAQGQSPPPPAGNVNGSQPAPSGPGALRRLMSRNLEANGYQPGQLLPV